MGEINQQGAVLKVDEVQLVDKPIFADRFYFFAAFVLLGSVGNLVKVIFFSNADLRVGSCLTSRSGLLRTAGVSAWHDDFKVFFRGFHSPSCLLN